MTAGGRLSSGGGRSASTLDYGNGCMTLQVPCNTSHYIQKARELHRCKIYSIKLLPCSPEEEKGPFLKAFCCYCCFMEFFPIGENKIFVGAGYDGWGGHMFVITALGSLRQKDCQKLKVQ